MKDREQQKRHQQRRNIRRRLQQSSVPIPRSPFFLVQDLEPKVSEGYGWKTVFSQTRRNDFIHTIQGRREGELVRLKGPEPVLRKPNKAREFLSEAVKRRESQEAWFGELRTSGFFERIESTLLAEEIYREAVREFGNTNSLAAYAELRQRFAGFALARIARELVKVSPFGRGKKVLTGNEALDFCSQFFYEGVPIMESPFDQSSLKNVSVPDGFIVGDDGKITHAIEYTLADKKSFFGVLLGFQKLRIIAPQLFAKDAKLLIVLPKHAILYGLEYEMNVAGVIDVLRLPFKQRGFTRWFRNFISGYKPNNESTIDQVAIAALERHGIEIT